METLENKDNINHKAEHKIIEKKSRVHWITGALLIALIFVVLYLNGMGIYTQDSWYR